MKFSLKLLAAAVALTAASAASAQTAGNWAIQVGANQITPKVESGDISAPALPHTKGDVGKDTEPVLIFNYAVTDNIQAEFALGMPYKHELVGAGAIAGTGKVGTVEALPPTLFAQYHFFDANARVRPYLGLGATYARFQKATGSGQLTAITNPGGPPTTFKIDNKFTYTMQIGVSVALTDKYFLDMSTTKTKLKTMVHFSTGQIQDMKLDPVSIKLAIGYKF
ncbi:OmpW family protein [Massilia sp. TS11]|uniref:OmpW/AlkL family protein n=1 Tax=Massilia sp. TS11 TaxID=2908003 RepID=UPI001EDC4831|nr:OmpW family outer membrane protein [Massilia sp. TS11]MCG2586423.1 outer membrane beta-barrel protein [Massilia sp. TS11]